MVARRTQLHNPRQLSLALLIELFSAHDWSLEHRKSVRCSLVSFCEWCIGNELMDSNPAMLLPKMPGDKPRPRPCPDDVWRDLLDAASPRERVMARLAGEAGLRRAEVAGMRRDDVVRDRTGWALIVRGKGGKQRVVPITESLAAEVIGFCQHGYLFPGAYDGHMSPQWVGTVISKLMPPGWTMHKLRHRFATRGYAGTRNLRAVQEALGHASVATTERYTMTTRDEIRAVSEAAGESTGPLPVA
ncbi:MAG: tyrosine-type recombinase/integrase [Mycobacterium sp.]